jgi:hypothetical protein
MVRGDNPPLSHKKKGQTVMDEWKAICKEWCRQNKATLLFVKDDSFGCEMPNGKFAHIYAEELVQMLERR